MAAVNAAEATRPRSGHTVSKTLTAQQTEIDLGGRKVPIVNLHLHFSSRAVRMKQLDLLLDWLRENGVDVIELDNTECREMLEGYIAAHPEVWNEDIGEE